MHASRCLLLLSLSAVAPACGRTPTLPEDFAPGRPPLVLERGESPRQILSWRPQGGPDRATLDVTYCPQSSLGSPVCPVEKYDYTTLARPSDRGIEVTAHVEEVRDYGREPGDEIVPDALAGRRDLTFGLEPGGRLHPPSDLPTHELWPPIALTVVEFPRTPVGVGARWQVDREILWYGESVPFRITYFLRFVEGDEVRVFADLEAFPRGGRSSTRALCDGCTFEDGYGAARADLELLLTASPLLTWVRVRVETMQGATHPDGRHLTAQRFWWFETGRPEWSIENQMRRQ